MLLETDECAIDPNGACVSISVYKKYLSNREYDEPLSRYFSASNYTYCSTNDSICSTCITEWTTNYEMTGNAGSTRYCTGSDGCVCVAASGVPDWEQNVISRQCDGSSDSDSVSSPEFSSATQICVILGICFGAVMGFSVFAVRRWFRSAVSRSSGSAHYHPSGPQLSLTGWKSLREKLIETEHSFVNGGTTRLDATARSDESLSEAPSVIMESCEKPRTCYDCLNKGIGGDSCAVGVFGQCLSISEQITGEAYYMATICERETRNLLVIHNKCPSFEKAKAGSIILVIAVGVASVIVFSMFTLCLKKLLKRAFPWLEQVPPDQSMLSRRLPPKSPRGPQLSLSGWKSMRETLIETEKGNGAPNAGAAGVMRIQLSTTEGTSVIIEEGDGYRPGSPSERYRAHRQEDISPALGMLSW
ncbi:hypothetical protein PI126_g8033 [Phytophthora idaei]|nr:hypothetical protein PI126_g8033 [Phytophthora idaei]